MMENYGFSLVTNEEASDIGLPNGSGLFDELYDSMVSEISKNFKNKKEYGVAENMTIEEKKISFMNRYFIFRKTHNVNAENLYKLFINKYFNKDSEEIEENPKEDVVDVLKEVDSDKKEEEKIEEVNEDVKQPIIIKKLVGKKKKLVIGKSQISDESNSNTVIIKKKKDN